MTRYSRSTDALKTHRRDQFIEWIKGLLAVPFVLLSQPTAIHAEDKSTVNAMAKSAHTRYAEIMRDVEELIQDHIGHQKAGSDMASKLKLLCPSIGMFFTPLPMQDAFKFQDQKRNISSRRFVAPSFNDIRLILNTAQAMSLVHGGRLELATFDGDVTLYDDGEVLEPDNPCIPRILDLLRKGTKIGIVTAAGYTEAEKYYERLHGLLNAVANNDPNGELEHSLVVMGGESNFLFTYSSKSPFKLEPVPQEDWQLPEMRTWTEENVKSLLDVAEAALKHSVSCLGLPVTVLRKSRAVGIYPEKGTKLAREQLEETVLVVQRVLEMSDAGRRIPFCAFNGGNDVRLGSKILRWKMLTSLADLRRYWRQILGCKSLSTLLRRH